MFHCLHWGQQKVVELPGEQAESGTKGNNDSVILKQHARIRRGTTAHSFKLYGDTPVSESGMNN